MKVQQTVYETLPTGDYSAVVAEIAEAEGMYGPQAAWLFTINEGPHSGDQVRAWTSAKFSPKSRLYQWAQAAFGGAEIPPGYDFDSDDLIGRQVTITLVVRAKDDGTDFNRVDAVRKWRAPAGQAAAAAAPSLGEFPPKGGANDIPF